MRFKLGRPPHGWSTLAWEAGVVVVGVLIALGAQQIADNLYWQGQAAQARSNIQQELLEHEKDNYERLAIQPCLRGQLAALSARLADTDGHWKAMPMTVMPDGVTNVSMKVIPSAYRAPERSWLDEAYKTAQATGALNHLPDAVVADYARAYQLSRMAMVLQFAEEDAAAQLSPLAVDGVVSPDARLDFFAALSRVDHANSYLENDSRQEALILNRLLKDVPVATRQAGVNESINVQRKFRGPCVLLLELRP